MKEQKLHDALIAAKHAWWQAKLHNDQNGMNAAVSQADYLRSLGAYVSDEETQTINREYESQLNPGSGSGTGNGTDPGAGADTGADTGDDATTPGYDLAKAKEEILQARRAYWLAWITGAQQEMKEATEAEAMIRAEAKAANVELPQFDPGTAEMKLIFREALVEVERRIDQALVRGEWQLAALLTQKRDELRAKNVSTEVEAPSMPRLVLTTTPTT